MKTKVVPIVGIIFLISYLPVSALSQEDTRNLLLEALRGDSALYEHVTSRYTLNEYLSNLELALVTRELNSAKELQSSILETLERETLTNRRERCVSIRMRQVFL